MSTVALPTIPTGQSRYEAFRVTGWIGPHDVEGDPIRISTTEPMTRDAAALLAMVERARVEPGVAYTRLHVNRTLWMSDTRDEYIDHVSFISRARGRVLLHGLGLGCSLKAILQKPEVEHVDVVEISEDVLRVVGAYFAGDERVNLIHDDALTREWPKGERWDVVWHDIWDVKQTDDLSTTRATLNRRFGRRADWQGAWAQEQLIARRRAEQGSWWS